MPNIVASVIFDNGRHFRLRPIVGINLKISDLEKIVLFGHSDYDMIKFLKFLLCQVRKLVKALFVALIKLIFVMENYLVVGLIKDKLTIGLLNWRVILRVLPYIL